MIGQLLGGYRVLERVGEGPNGTVWRAEHPELGSVVAIKVLPADLALNPSDRERFERGSRAAAKLNHPGIATVFGAEFSGATPYIVSEFVDGETVNARTEAGPLPARQAVEVVLQAARALEYAHQQGVFHRDISGGNVMVTAEGRCKIVDFGIAVERDATRKTTQGTVLGTWAYMAPEALRDETVSESRDTYALGVIFYQLLTGRLPFVAETFEGLVYRILNDDARPPSVYRADLPASVDRLVLRVLEKNPKLRVTIDRLITELEGLQASGALDTKGWRERSGLGSKIDRAIGQLARQLTTMAPSQTRRLLLMAGVSIASIALVSWVTMRLLPQGPVKPKVASLAIIPLFNESHERGFEYIGHGLAEHLAGRLGGLEGLLVQPYRKWLVGDAVELCGQLNVEGVLEGAFRVEGGLVETRLDLVHADGTREVIARTKSNGYKRAAEEMAINVAHGLKSRLTQDEAARVSSPVAGSNEAFDALSTAVEAHQRGDRDDALLWYERAVSLDPGLAKAYVGIGSIHYDRFYRGTGSTQSLGIAQANYRHALALEPDNGGAERGLILVHFELGEVDSALARGHRASLRDPSVETILMQAWALTLTAHPEFCLHAVPLLKRAIELDPMSEEAHWLLVLATVWAGQYDETVRAGNEFFRRFDEDAEMHQWVALAYWGLRDMPAARHHFERALDLFQDNTQLSVSVFAGDFFMETGESGKARAIWSNGLRVARDRSVAAPDNARGQGILCELYLKLGQGRDFENAIALVDEALGNGKAGSRIAWLSWAGDAYAKAQYRRRVIDIARRWLPYKCEAWHARWPTWSRAEPDMRNDAELASIASAARAYADSLLRKYGVRPQEDRPGGPS